MSDSPLDALLARVDEALSSNTEIVAEADRTLSGSPYMAVLRANRADTAARAQARAAQRVARDALGSTQRAGTTRVDRLNARLS
jgi:hypothetical protein